MPPQRVPLPPPAAPASAVVAGVGAAWFARVSCGAVLDGEWRLCLSSAAAGQRGGTGMAGGEGEEEEAEVPPSARLALQPMAGEPSSALSLASLQVHAGALDASRCLAAGSGLQAATIGVPSFFTITPCDANGYAKRVARGAPFR